MGSIFWFNVLANYILDNRPKDMLQPDGGVHLMPFFVRCVQTGRGQLCSEIASVQATQVRAQLHKMRFGMQCLQNADSVILPCDLSYSIVKVASLPMRVRPRKCVGGCALCATRSSSASSRCVGWVITPGDNVVLSIVARAMQVALTRCNQ